MDNAFQVKPFTFGRDLKTQGISANTASLDQQLLTGQLKASRLHINQTMEAEEVISCCLIKMIPSFLCSVIRPCKSIFRRYSLL